MDKAYWTKRYQEGKTGWDLGKASAPLIDFCISSVGKDQRILIPGAGNAYDAEALFHLGYTKVFVLDISPEPLQRFAERCPAFPSSHLLEGDFFDLTTQFDIVLEQTFFCALDPSLRPAYVKQMAKTVTPGGSLAGVWFNFPLKSGPPFGGSADLYHTLLSTDFDILRMEPCRNSMPGREGKELFTWVKRKKNPAV